MFHIVKKKKKQPLNPTNKITNNQARKEQTMIRLLRVRILTCSSEFEVPPSRTYSSQSS